MDMVVSKLFDSVFRVDLDVQEENKPNHTYIKVSDGRLQMHKELAERQLNEEQMRQVRDAIKNDNYRD